MRILIISYEFPPLGGGGAKVVAGLARQLAIDGHQVDILTSRWRGLPAVEEVQGATVYRIKTLRFRADRSNALELAVYVAAMAPALRRRLKSQAYDVCNCHFIFPDGLITPVLRRWSNGPIVITAHGSDVPGFNPERFRLLHRLLLPLWRWIVRSADSIVCPSSTLQGLLLTHEAAARTVVIPNGFDPSRFEPDPRRADRVLVVSRLFKRKGVQDLIRAFAQVGNSYQLHVVGDGPYRPELEGLAREIAGEDRVVFRGWLENDSQELKELYESSAIFVLPSRAENFPVSLLEAMAGGAAVITTRGTGCEEVAGGTALLVEPGDVSALQDALRQLISNAELRKRLAEAGRKRMETRFTWSRVSQSYVEVFSGENASPPGMLGPK